jgi:hypothetical protein
MYDDGGTPFEGAAQIGRGDGVVDEQRQSGVVGDAGHALDVEHVERGVAERFGAKRFGLRRDRAGEVLGFVGVDEYGIDAELAEIDIELGVGAAVQRARRNDLVAGLDDVEPRGHPARYRNCGAAAFERGDGIRGLRATYFPAWLTANIAPMLTSDCCVSSACRFPRAAKAIAGITRRWKAAGDHWKTNWSTIIASRRAAMPKGQSPSTSKSSTTGFASRRALAICHLLRSCKYIMINRWPLKPLDSVVYNRPHHIFSLCFIPKLQMGKLDHVATDLLQIPMVDQKIHDSIHAFSSLRRISLRAAL